METSMREWLEPIKVRLADVIRLEPGPEAKQRLMATLTGLGELLARYRKEMPNELVHYLERRSYEKAARFCDEVNAGGEGK